MHKWLKIVGGILIAFILISAGGLLFLAKNPERAATFADSVLRPLIGDKAVITLEGFAFGLQDKVNHLKKQPDATSYSLNVQTNPVQTIAPVATAQAAASPTPLPFAPAAITPYTDQSHPLAQEGVWQSIVGTPLFTTFIRTDPTRDYSVVNLVYIPMHSLNIAAVAGTKHPGGSTGLPGPGKIPLDIQNSGNLIAAFNGGFQEKDGHYGMFADNTTYVPLRSGLATLFIYQDGHTTLSPYDGKPLSTDIVAARQNGLLLVANNQTNKLTSQGVSLWAGTASGDYITWRSGLGETADGDLIYAVGPSLTPTALADALRLAGSQNAMELDVNTYWVRFMLYTWQNGSYSSSTLVKGLADGGKAYLNGYEKDFFYIYRKPNNP